MLTAHPVAGKQKSRDICAAFIDGAPRDAKGAVFYGVNESNSHAWCAAKASGEDWYYIDNSYFDSVRGSQFRVSKNAYTRLEGEGETDGHRFAQLSLEIKPWREQGTHVVVCPQSMSFMYTVAQSPVGWAWGLCNVLNRTTRPFVVREWSRDKAEKQRTLAADLVDAWVLVTHSSAACVTAMLAGIPTWSTYLHGAIVDIEQPPMPADRLRWAGVLADNQFTLNEFRNGAAWAWLNR